jgi:hypothetical protein
LIKIFIYLFLLEMSLKDFKCLDFDFLKNRLKSYLILDLTNIITYYLEPNNEDFNYLYNEEMREDYNLPEDKLVLQSITKTERKNIIQNISEKLFVIQFTGYQEYKYYGIAKLKKDKFGQIKYLLYLRIEDNIELHIKSNIYELLNLKIEWVFINSIMSKFYEHYFSVRK